MKKISYLSFLLLCTISFSQNKISKTTNNQTKEVVKVEPKLEDKIITTRIIDSDFDAVISPDVESSHTLKPDENTIYNSAGIEVKPEFPGGAEKMNLFISKNLKYSDEMIKNEIKGKVYASLIVEKDGSLSDVKIIRDCGYNTGKMAIEIVKKMPKWHPGIQNGKNVRCTFLFPIIIDATKQ